MLAASLILGACPLVIATSMAWAGQRGPVSNFVQAILTFPQPNEWISSSVKISEVKADAAGGCSHAKIRPMKSRNANKPKYWTLSVRHVTWPREGVNYGDQRAVTEAEK